MRRRQQAACSGAKKKKLLRNMSSTAYQGRMLSKARGGHAASAPWWEAGAALP